MSKIKIFAALILLSALLLLPACGEKDMTADTSDSTSESIIIESGVGDRDTTESTDSEELVDKGEKATVADLIAAQKRIRSCYFEQTVDYPSGSVFIQVWYKDGLMKLISSVNSYVLNECYYDYAGQTLVTYYQDSAAVTQSVFDPTSADAPDNPVLENYADYKLLDGEKIGEQYCLKLETPEGDWLWVSTASGFPLKAEFNDSLGDRMTTYYENIRLNEVEDSDLQLPDDIAELLDDTPTE